MIHIHHQEDVACFEGIVRVGDWESAPIIAASSGEFDSLYIVTSVLAVHLPFPEPDSILEG
ncbi:hypothetical protein HP567_010440 [Brevibacillus sp. M2.1A]|uniref:hypothetical protein n=1 Tax=Brevibacillus TaxID=55080 RepID=UPI00156AAF76|nr:MULTISPECIES: hypothetical protein [Brevibacillus]MCC8434958.1 hypothetical protein [Brevibacillus sp. M2.1A]MCM3146276.1 hypothetical protein [Brevibacillus sp. MER 51]